MDSKLSELEEGDWSTTMIRPRCGPVDGIFGYAVPPVLFFQTWEILIFAAVWGGILWVLAMKNMTPRAAIRALKRRLAGPDRPVRRVNRLSY